MKVNINNHVLVKLTETGLEELRRQGEELRQFCPGIGPWEPPKTDAEGYSRFQMHALMSRLGYLCQMGCSLPFETEIIIED